MSNKFDKKVGNKKVISGFNYFFLGLICLSYQFQLNPDAIYESLLD